MALLVVDYLLINPVGYPILYLPYKPVARRATTIADKDKPKWLRDVEETDETHPFKCKFYFSSWLPPPHYEPYFTGHINGGVPTQRVLILRQVYSAGSGNVGDRRWGLG